MKVVIDTNVLVCGFLSPFGAAAQVIDLVLGGDIKVAYDDRIIAEYHAVLARERFGFPRIVVEAIIQLLRAEGEQVMAQPLRRPLAHVTDAPFLEVALASQADALITLNKRHFPSRACGTMPVMTPQEFLVARASGFNGR